MRAFVVSVCIIMPPPRGLGHNAVIGVRRPSVCPSVRPSDVAYIGSNSKTKRRRKTKLCTGVRYPRSHATPTPTSRSKGQKSRSRGGVILWRPSSRTAEHQQSCHLANGCRYNVIKVLLNTAMLIIIQSNHFRVNSAV